MIQIARGTDMLYSSKARLLVELLLSIGAGYFLVVFSWQFSFATDAIWLPGNFLSERLFPGIGMHDRGASRLFLTAFSTNGLFWGLGIYAALRILLLQFRKLRVQ